MVEDWIQKQIVPPADVHIRGSGARRAVCRVTVLAVITANSSKKKGEETAESARLPMVFRGWLQPCVIRVFRPVHLSARTYKKRTARLSHRRLAKVPGPDKNAIHSVGDIPAFHTPAHPNRRGPRGLSGACWLLPLFGNP